MALNAIIKAAKFAYDAHYGQFRKWDDNHQPYINHPARVASLVGCYSGEMITIQAAWLHDVLEDTDVTYNQLEEEFGKNVAQYVWGLTNASKSPEHCNKPRAERKQIDLEHNLQFGKEVCIIKLCDRLDNITGRLPSGFKQKYLRESAAIAEAMFEYCTPVASQILEICNGQKKD